MDYSSIKTGLEGFVERYDSQTYIGSYRDTNRSSLLNEGLATRANSLWKMAEYVVAKYDKTTNPIDSYIRGWKQLAAGANNQYLLLEESKDVWGMYDAQGNRLGGEDYIKVFFLRKKREQESTNLRSNTTSTPLHHPLQRIYYGAPGTGKSFEITQKTKGSKDVVRTTFHPDSDYSTFVGAYKPTMGKGKVYGAQGPLRDNGKDVEEPKIVYEFVEQAFLQAYILAWEKYAKDHEEKQFLVIEEINRGNCAQIFGDIFQLLDRRKDGFSDYPINPDKDIRLHLKQKLENLSLTDIPTIDNIDGNDLGAMIRNGEKMLLPPNLYIWATMNTSDQSLFPIDSAFKRRWDWKYMPIDTKKECWYIKVGNDRYSWTAFFDSAFLNDDLAALEDLSELLQLTVHCYYDSYFHLLMYFCPSLI